KSYVESLKETYNSTYERWMPYIEDLYLKYFTNENKTSYAVKDAADRPTGVQPIDKATSSVGDLVGGQMGKGGAFENVGDAVGEEGVNRMERGGKGDDGSYLGSMGSGVASGVDSVGSGVANTVKGAGGYVGGLMGGGKEEE
ncbi:hypothetical protein K470DRAFT_207202, partial [Piedraia hortae CBS 480.64]